MTSNPDAAPAGRTAWRLGGLLAVLAVPLAVVWWPGCREYPAVTSKESLGLMKLLYTACNTRDPARLARVEEGLGRADREGKLSPPERAAFAKVVAMAKAGDWAAAEAAAFKFAQDQVGRGHPAPHDHDHHDTKPPPKGKPGR